MVCLNPSFYSSAAYNSLFEFSPIFSCLSCRPALFGRFWKSVRLLPKRRSLNEFVSSPLFHWRFSRPSLMHTAINFSACSFGTHHIDEIVDDRCRFNTNNQISLFFFCILQEYTDHLCDAFHYLLPHRYNRETIT